MPFHAARLLRAMNNKLVHSTLNGTTSTVRCGICYGSIGEVCCTEQYDKTSCRSLVNDVRVDLFARKGRDVLHIPPTQGCLIEHVCEEGSISGRILLEPVTNTSGCPSATRRMGLDETAEGTWEIFWSKLPEASKVCRELLCCGCTKGC